MKNFREYLQEAFNSPYKWEWKNKRPGGIEAHFKDSENRPFIIDLSRGFGKWYLGFGIDKGDNLGLDYTNTGFNDSLRVLSTVLDVLKVFIKTNPDVEEIGFSGSEEEGKARLYKKMLKHFKPALRRLGFEVGETGIGGLFVIQKVGN